MLRRRLELLIRDVTKRLEEELSPDLQYHDAVHTLEDVVPATLRLARAEGVVGVDLELLHAAALLHDIGYIRSMVDHEIVGAAIATEMLPECGFDAEEIASVERLILATRIGHRPQSLSEAIIADADLDVLGRGDFWHRHRALQRELAALGTVHDDAAWTALQQRFLRQHTYHTAAARLRGSAGKRANERRIETRLRRLARLAERRAEKGAP